MSAVVVSYAFLALFIKHFVFDFILQGPYQYLNKGTYGHPGGILHSGLQAVGSFIVLVPFVGFTVALAVVCAIEFLVHYHVDWAKMNLNKRWGLKPDNSEYFWWLLGADQLLHYLTYFGMIFFLI